MKRRFFVIGDVEMGKGDLMDDFHDDETLVKFMDHVSSFQDDELTVIFNGDTFDFLKMDYEGKYPRYITEEMSMWKLERVLTAHGQVFEALRKFLQLPHVKLVFVIGNHDPDLVWPKVQQRLREVLGGQESQVLFTHAFNDEHFHAQHGNLIDPLFGFNHEKPIIRHWGKYILNLPVGTHMSAQYMMGFKKNFHDQEVMYPQREVIKKYPDYRRALRAATMGNSIRIFILDPIIHFGDPMYRIPYTRILWHLLKYGFDGVHDDRFLDIQELDARFGKKSLYVLAHAHVRKDLKHADRRYLFVDCWRTERDVRTEDLRKKPKTYAEIGITDGVMAEADLKEFALR